MEPKLGHLTEPIWSGLLATGKLNLWKPFNSQMEEPFRTVALAVFLEDKSRTIMERLAAFLVTNMAGLTKV